MYFSDNTSMAPYLHQFSAVMQKVSENLMLELPLLKVLFEMNLVSNISIKA